LVFFAPTVYSICEKTSSRAVKKYVIDLDKPARDRFTETATDFANEIGSLIEAQK
jgi:hypothetical protein